MVGFKGWWLRWLCLVVVVWELMGLGLMGFWVFLGDLFSRWVWYNMGFGGVLWVGVVFCRWLGVGLVGCF